MSDSAGSDFAGGTCCTTLIPTGSAAQAFEREREQAAYAYVRHGEGADNELFLLVDGIHCGSCIQKIERTLNSLTGVVRARVNMSTGRVVVGWNGDELDPSRIVAAIDAIGYRAVPFDPEKLTKGTSERERQLLKAMAVAGFAAANVMLLSVSVWAGAFQDMGPYTRSLMLWVSALIALPAIAYSGRPFFQSALGALKAGRTNMDVPVSLAVILAAGMSLSETMRGAEHAYFDSAVSLLFFLLIGRYLDSRARGRARAVAENLMSLNAKAVLVEFMDGQTKVIAPEHVQAGMIARVAPGERIPVDGEIVDGRSDVDTSLITGESIPETVGPGKTVYAGTLNLSGALRLRIKAVGEGTLLADIARLMENAEQRKARHVALADRIARWYAPVVHILAASTFLGWWLFAGLGWQDSLLIAIAVLVITCPCAIGLAVPVVQVVASGLLMRRGVLLKSGSALERVAEVDTVVFDKTGTLTLGRPKLDCENPIWNERDRLFAASLAANSLHPLSRALVASVSGPVEARSGVREIPGCGLEWEGPDGLWRLGSSSWLNQEADRDDKGIGSELWFVRPGKQAVRFMFHDTLREDAADVVAYLKSKGLRVCLISGDREGSVRDAARQAGIEEWSYGNTPEQKVARLDEMEAEGRRVLMIGDGMNDAPALAKAHVSLSPTTAADISQNAADIVFQGVKLSPVILCMDMSRTTRLLVRENFLLAFMYNIFTVPLAIAGFVTPLIAAIAMSSSSLIVIGNALRLGLMARFRRPS